MLYNMRAIIKQRKGVSRYYFAQHYISICKILQSAKSGNVSNKSKNLVLIKLVKISRTTI